MELSTPAVMDLMYGSWVSGRTQLSLSDFRPAITWLTLVMVCLVMMGRKTHMVDLVLVDALLEPKLHNVDDSSHYEQVADRYKANSERYPGRYVL